MRRFTSYGPVDTEKHFYAPRRNLIDWVYTQLMEDNPLKGGYYITVWAPRQTGKSWIMLRVLEQIRKQKAGKFIRKITGKLTAAAPGSRFTLFS